MRVFHHMKIKISFLYLIPCGLRLAIYWGKNLIINKIIIKFDLFYNYIFYRQSKNVYRIKYFKVFNFDILATGINPTAPSARLAGHIWAFFTLIIISFYTANLAAFLTVSQLNNPINSIFELSHQTKVKYWIVAGGTTEKFFKVF